MKSGEITYLDLAAGAGLEPEFSGPEPDVLPLDDPAICGTNPAITLLLYNKNAAFSTLILAHTSNQCILDTSL